MRLSPAAFNRFLDGIGQRILWERAATCPCIEPHSGAAKPGCPLCHGKGWIYSGGVECLCGIASQKVQKNWAQLGMYEAGDSVLVIQQSSAAYEAGRGDKITMRDGSDRFSRVLIRGRNDRIYDKVQKFERCFWLNTAGDAVIEGGLPTVAADGSLTWASGEPPAGVKYTIEGQRLPVYWVFGPYPSDRNEHSGALLPKNLVAKRWDVGSR